MKKLICMILVLSMCGCSPTPTKNTPEIVNTYSVSDFLSKLDGALIAVAAVAKGNGLKLDQVKLDFNVVLAEETSGELKILFLKFGRASKNATTTSYVITLGAPEDLAKRTGQVSGAFLQTFADALKELIANSDQYKVAGLVTHEISASLKFYIKDHDTGGLAHEFEVVPVSLKIGDATTEESTQTITLKFIAHKKEKKEEKK